MPRTTRKHRLGSRHLERNSRSSGGWRAATYGSTQLPAVYPYRQFAELGGLLSYGFDRLDSWRRAAGYVDRILKEENPGDLPVQAPTRYELVLNLKTAKALGSTYLGFSSSEPTR